MEFVTGKAGVNHISGADMAAMYRGLLIADDVVLADGDQLACTMVNANTAEIAPGSCMLQAHHARVEVAEQVTIESGSPGYKRNDLIVARYTLGDGNVQQVYLDVVKGTPVAGTASDPAVTEGDIDGGDVLAEFPLWRIPLDGVSVGTPVRVMPTVDTLQDQISDNADAIATNTSDISSLRESVYPNSKKYSLRGVTAVRLNGTAFMILLDRPRGATFQSASISGAVSVTQFTNFETKSLTVNSVSESQDSSSEDTIALQLFVDSTSVISGYISTVCFSTVNFRYE